MVSGVVEKEYQVSGYRDPFFLQGGRTGPVNQQGEAEGGVGGQQGIAGLLDPSVPAFPSR